MQIKRPMQGGVSSSEITSEADFNNRRRIIKALGISSVVLASGAAIADTLAGTLYQTDVNLTGPAWLEDQLAATKLSPYSTDETATPLEYIAGYNNFYEFGTSKTDPASNATGFVTDPWQVEIAGEAEKTGIFNLEDIVKPHALEERVYRLRCVEAWSMVVPWIGISLADLLKRFNPTSDAKYVKFETLFDPEQMPGQAARFKAIEYPYVEGLRIDEAMNELAFLAVGVYGKAMPNQNGAPIRLVVPWKYGFKSIKSIVKIEFTKHRPQTTWEKSNPREYGFYANVNPGVDHPRWSQGTERRLPSSLFSRNTIETRLFNGYESEVAHLYKNMNLNRNF